MSKKKSGFGKFLLGAGIGAGLAMLFTKNNGKENREQLKKKVDELIVKVKEIEKMQKDEGLTTKRKEHARELYNARYDFRNAAFKYRLVFEELLFEERGLCGD